MSTTEEARNSVEFIAFLLWYSFLVFCCVLPTCCAYRRRQMLMQLQREEAEFEQRYFFGQFGVATDDGNRNAMDDEEARAERTRRITAALKATSFVVSEKDIVQNQDQDDVDINVNVAENKEPNESKVQVDEEMGEGDIMMDQHNTTLQLPKDGENAGGRSVPGGCAICLDTYNAGDEVIWSPLTSCPHAFHQDCIIPWLAKKEEPKCPCCRQTYCEVEAVRATETSTAVANTSMDPFGLIPSGFIMRQNISQNGRELIIIPSANLIVSQTVDDRGMLGLRIAERGDPPALGGAAQDTEAAEENSSAAVENSNDTSPNQAGDMAAAQASSEIEMEQLGDRSTGAEEAPSSEQSPLQDSDPPSSDPGNEAAK